jgi:Nicotinic acid phosphoribosyltransferase
VYGIGTYLSNDVGVGPLNMVIKLVGVKPHGQESFIPAVKLSDSMGKHSGDADEIALCLKIVNR